MISLDSELLTALLHLIQAEDRAVMFHYPEEIRDKIKLLKRATYKVRQEAQHFRQSTSVQQPSLAAAGERTGNGH